MSLTQVLVRSSCVVAMCSSLIAFLTCSRESSVTADDRGLSSNRLASVLGGQLSCPQPTYYPCGNQKYCSDIPCPGEVSYPSCTPCLDHCVATKGKTKDWCRDNDCKQMCDFEFQIKHCQAPLPFPSSVVNEVPGYDGWGFEEESQYVDLYSEQWPCNEVCACQWYCTNKGTIENPDWQCQKSSSCTYTDWVDEIKDVKYGDCPGC